jgi:hypothetical protein
MAAAATKSDEGKQAFAAENLAHSSLHDNVRWNFSGIPPVQVGKDRVYLELLHSIPINAANLQCKHAWLKYMPDELRFQAAEMFRRWGLPIDTRKPEKRTQPKWPGGGEVKYLIDGGNGKCPGFAVVGAELTFLLAEYVLAEKKKREVDAAKVATAASTLTPLAGSAGSSKTVAAAAAVGVNVFNKPTSKRKGASALPLAGAKGKAPAAASSQPASAEASARPAPAPEPVRPKFETLPLESQSSRCTPEEAKVIKDRYGPYLGQRVISTLISADTFR